MLCPNQHSICSSQVISEAKGGGEAKFFFFSPSNECTADMLSVWGLGALREYIIIILGLRRLKAIYSTTRYKRNADIYLGWLLPPN